ncbi:MAG: Rrf2 family transcriptional regulator [Flavobacteriaceae bacterium]|nr:Rrf2 family transcriptional regulator [Flavobacteriaceae bacterium]
MISKKAKYAINALVYLAKIPKNQPISVMTIAESQNIPLKFLENILAELKKAKIVDSKRGKYGGYFLNHRAEEIHMATIMRMFDGAIAILPCVTYRYYKKCEECEDEATCGIRQVAMEIRNETVKRLKNATLADIVKREKNLKEKKLF